MAADCAVKRRDSMVCRGRGNSSSQHMADRRVVVVQDHKRQPAASCRHNDAADILVLDLLRRRRGLGDHQSQVEVSQAKSNARKRGRVEQHLQRSRGVSNKGLSEAFKALRQHDQTEQKNF